MLYNLQTTWQADVPESAVTHKVVAVCHIAALHHRHHYSQHFLQSRTSDARRMKKRIKQVRRPRSWKVSYGDVFTASPYCLLTRCYGANPIRPELVWQVDSQSIVSAAHILYIQTCPLHLYCSHAMFNFPSFRFRFRFRFSFRFRFIDSQEHLWTECPVLLWKHLICFQQVVSRRWMAAGSIEPAMGELGLDHRGLEAVRGSELNVSAWE